MSAKGKVNLDKFELRQKKNVDEMCFNFCFKSITSEFKASQQNCVGNSCDNIENCVRKLVNGLSFISEYEKLPGLYRTPNQ